MFRFTIRELLLVTLTAALALGWWVDQQSKRDMVPIFFQAEVGQDERLDYPWSAGQTIQQLLMQTGGTKRYARFEVELVRPNSRGGYQTIRCQFDPVVKQFSPNNDCIVLPGDQVLVKETTLFSAVQPRTATFPHRRTRTLSSNFGEPLHRAK